MIFCVEDDEAAGHLEAYALETIGYQTRIFRNSKEFAQGLKEETPDLILLDIMLPGEDGISILKKLKANADTTNIPVIMTTAKGTEFDKVAGLDLGADDYLVKPFGMMEMVSRVKAVLRRVTRGGEDNRILHCEGIRMNLPEHMVTVDGQVVELTLKEFGLLQLLLEHPGRVFSRDTILERIWNTEYAGDTRTVDVHVATLRTKLGDYGSLIQTVRGIGYKLEAA